MAFSIQTNVNSMTGQENLRLNQEFQSRTINRLTSGYRINSAADDAAGLSVANKYRNDVASLQQGVRNANDGMSTLQIIDGGLNNISKILDRMTTLATQAATETFAGDRSILQGEYDTLLGEINRQAANVGLGRGSETASRFNVNLGTYIGGGGDQQANSKVTVNLGTASDLIDSQALGLSATTIVGGGVNKGTGNSVTTLKTGTFLASGTQAFTVHTTSGTLTATIGNNGTAISGADAVAQLNSQIGAVGLKATITDDGELQFSGGSGAYTVTAGAAVGGAVATAATTWDNNTLYRVKGQTTYSAVTVDARDITVNVDGVDNVVSLATTTTQAQARAQLNAALNSKGVYVVDNAAGTGLDFQSAKSFTVKSASASGAATGVFGTNAAAGTNQTVTNPAADASKTGNALQALDSISKAVTQLTTVQGKIGTGLNKFQYAIQLAQSQISNFSAAESRIRDADVAAEAANLTKAQVLQQASMAAMAQANLAPQSIVALLRS